jgi:hypothetical protein
MDKWPEDYECDGQLSLFEKDRGSRMNEYRVIRKINGLEHKTRINAQSRFQAIETVQRQYEYTYPCATWEFVGVEESVEK